MGLVEHRDGEMNAAALSVGAAASSAAGEGVNQFSVEPSAAAEMGHTALTPDTVSFLEDGCAESWAGARTGHDVLLEEASLLSTRADLLLTSLRNALRQGLRKSNRSPSEPRRT